MGSDGYRHEEAGKYGRVEEGIYCLEEIDITRFPSSILTGLRPVSGDDAVLRAEELHRENASEVWILQCPTNVQLSTLIQGKKLFLDDRTQLFSADERSFETVCLPCDENHSEGAAALVADEFGKMQIVSFPLSGHIMIKESIENLPAVIPTPSPKKVHQLPSGLKIRHPIYGTDYEKMIVDLPPPSIPREKVKRKKRKAVEEEVEPEIEYHSPQLKRRRQASADIPKPTSSLTEHRNNKNSKSIPEVIYSVVEQPVKRKKSKYHEAEIHVLEFNDNEVTRLKKQKPGQQEILRFAANEETLLKKKKKSKQQQERHEFQLEANEEAPLKNNKKSKQRIMDVNGLEANEETPPKKKKSKEHEAEILTVVAKKRDTPKEKKKSKHHDIKIEHEKYEKKKKEKHHKFKEEYQQFEKKLKREISSVEEDEEKYKKRKKRKVITIFEDSLPSVSSKKKRKKTYDFIE